MHLRTRKRRLKDGSTAQYCQLVNDETHAKTGNIITRILHDFGRVNKGSAVHNQLVILCHSIAKACGLIVISDATDENAANHKHNSEIERLNRENTQLKKQLEKTKSEDQKLRAIFDNANDEILFVDTDGIIIEINENCVDLFGYSREEVIGKNFTDFADITSIDTSKVIGEKFSKVSSGEQPQIMEFKAYRKDGASFYAEVNVKTLWSENKIEGMIAIIRDITERKAVEEELLNYRNHLEKLVKERTDHLDESNIALRVMLKKEGEIKEEMENNILFNVQELISPYIGKLLKSRIDKKQQAYIEIISNNLNSIISPFINNLPTGYLKLTPTEIQVANLIKQGKPSKEIAELLNMSCRTVDTHRHNIRTKIGIKSKKANLRTWLLGD